VEAVLCCAFDSVCPSSILYTAHRRSLAVWRLTGCEREAETAAAARVLLTQPVAILSTRTDDDEDGDDTDDINQVLSTAARAPF
jgi:hypothetical protein